MKIKLQSSFFFKTVPESFLTIFLSTDATENAKLGHHNNQGLIPLEHWTAHGGTTEKSFKCPVSQAPISLTHPETVHNHYHHNPMEQARLFIVSDFPILTIHHGRIQTTNQCLTLSDNFSKQYRAILVFVSTTL